jgi:hypothetical protein
VRYAKTRLREDDFFGEGEVDFDEDFLDMPGLYRADVLGDWIAALTDEYNIAVKEMLEDIRKRAGVSAEVISLDDFK